ARLNQHGGAALIIDYGHAESANGDTLQAVRAHRAQSIYAEPGLADLTSHVDFEALRRAATGIQTHGPVTQASFLRCLGIEARAASLQRSATAQQARDIATALQRLLDPRQMGQLFKVVAMNPLGSPPPAGFERLEEAPLAARSTAS
ncbi:MAG: class I SAM-dependent methyltransferase, partial [Rhodospirillaceae bacterium]|nr:class I SAM-dependent methyltransferase [Rhodospirillaceae bacterium]